MALNVKFSMLQPKGYDALRGGASLRHVRAKVSSRASKLQPRNYSAFVGPGAAVILSIAFWVIVAKLIW